MADNLSNDPDPLQLDEETSSYDPSRPSETTRLPDSLLSEQRDVGNHPSSAELSNRTDEPPTPSLSFVTAQTNERYGATGRDYDTLEALPQLPRPAYLEANSATSTRPSSASNSVNHAPSLRLGAFSKPMSSQRLQANRGIRPASLQAGYRPASLDSDDIRSATTRNSTGSAVTPHIDHNLQQRYENGPFTVQQQGSFMSDWMSTSNKHAYIESPAEATTTAQHAQKPILTGQGETNIPKEDTTQANGWHQPSQKRESHSASNILANFAKFNKSTSAFSRTSGLEKLPSRERSPQSARMNRFGLEENTPIAKRNWEYAEGNLVFCFNGRLLNSRKKPVVLVTWVLVVFPSVLYFIFAAPYLWHHISPAIPLLYAYIFFLCISSLLHASLSDPGIYPRNLHVYPPASQNEDPLALGPPTTDWTQVRSTKASLGVFEVPTKYCKSCNIWRPPRCHHCRLCDSCVDTQDHHCMWLNNCVGRRNYRYFLSFVISTSVLAIWLLGSSIAVVAKWASQHNTSFTYALGQNTQNGVSFFLFLYGSLGFGYPMALAVYHTHLMAHAQTTREVLTSRNFLRKDRHRPFDQNSWWKNILVVLARPRPPAYMEFKRRHAPGDQRLGFEQHHQNTFVAALRSWVQLKIHQPRFRNKPSEHTTQSQASQRSDPGRLGDRDVEMRELGEGTGGRNAGRRGPLSGVFKNNTPRN